MSRLNEHIRALAHGIGARGSTTEEERKASVYCLHQLRGMELNPVLETFNSARSAWWPAAAFWGCMLISGILFQLRTTLLTTAGIAIALVALGSILLELQFRHNPIRALLPTGQSQNVWVRIDPSETPATHVALVAHLDTHRTPLVFSSDGWVRMFEKLVPIGMAFAVLQILVMASSLILALPLLRWIALVPMAIALGMLALMLQADRTPYSPGAGANDNASGVAVALEIAEQLSRQPLAHTAVWIVLTGCEEVGSYGAQDFLQRHASELDGGVWFTLDNIGSRDGVPVYLAQETFLTTAKSDPELLRMAHEIAAARPDLRAHEIKMKGAYTDGALGAKYGLRVLTFESHNDSGMLSDWHRPSDTVQNVSVECADATMHLIQHLLQRIDSLA